MKRMNSVMYRSVIMRHTLAYLLISSVLTTVAGHGSTAFTFELPDRQKSCFYEEYTAAADAVFQFNVLRGGRSDVDVIVEGPNNKILYKEIRKQRDTLNFQATTGLYAFCFSNEFSSMTHKRVFFELRLREKSPLAVEAGNKNPTANTQMEESLEHIHGSTTSVLQRQRSYRLREVKGRYMAEVLNRCVQWWSAAEAVVLVCIGLGQVFLLKCFFTDRRKPSAVSRSDVTGVLHAVPINESDAVVMPPSPSIRDVTVT